MISRVAAAAGWPHRVGKTERAYPARGPAKNRSTIELALHAVEQLPGYASGAKTARLYSSRLAPLAARALAHASSVAWLEPELATRR